MALPAATAAADSSPRSASSTTGDGHSSTIFWCRRWMEQSRSNRRDDAAVRVAEDLHLDVAGVDDVALQEHRAVAERRRRLPPGARDGLGQLPGVGDDPHAAPAAAERRLDQHREADAAAASAARSMSASTVTPGSIGTPAAAISALASIFEPMASIASGEGPTKVSPAAAQSRANPAFSDRNP